MTMHTFKRVEITDKAETAVCFFDYKYVVRGNRAILEKSIERVISEAASRGTTVKQKDLKFYIVEGERSDGYLSGYPIKDNEGVYKESARREVTLGLLEAEIGNFDVKK